MNNIISKDNRYWVKAEVTELYTRKQLLIDGNYHSNVPADTPTGEVLVEAEAIYSPIDNNNPMRYQLKSPIQFYKEVAQQEGVKYPTVEEIRQVIYNNVSIKKGCVTGYNKIAQAIDKLYREKNKPEN